MHPGSFEPRFHHELIPAFHDPAANRPALGLELGIGELALAFLQVHPVRFDLGQVRMGLG
jgi:hypothetical protein